MDNMDTGSEVSCHILISNVSEGLFSMCTLSHIWSKDGVNHETMPTELSLLGLFSSQKLQCQLHELFGRHQNMQAVLHMYETLKN
jgi:hypothetical protein